MIIGGCEGDGFRYEILALIDGFVVRMRDLDTGVIEDRETRLYRTAAVAFAYAEAFAAMDRCANALLDSSDDARLLLEARTAEIHYLALKARLEDEGAHLDMNRLSTADRRPVCH